MNCINCNIVVLQDKFNPLNKCSNCNAEHQDWYYTCDHSILIIDLILCKVEAYRHILLNRFHQSHKVFLFQIYGALFGIYVLLELFYKYQMSILKKDNNQEQQEQFQDYFTINNKEITNFSITSSTFHIIFVLIIQMSTIFICNIVVFQRIHKQLLPGLILSHFARLSIIMFVIWSHRPFFKQMASLSILLSELTVIRSICEQKGDWFKSLITLISALVLQKVISDYIMEIPNITIL